MEKEITRLLAGDSRDDLARAAAGGDISQAAQMWRELAELAGGCGFDPHLRALLGIPGVTDILINGAAAVWVDRGCGLHRIISPFRDDDAVMRLALQLAHRCATRLDPSHPIADGALGKLRIHAVIPPLARVPTLSLRLATARRLSVAEMVESGSLTARFGQICAALVHRRENVLVSGATGCGKTTFLNAILGLVSGQQRIICIEETPELEPCHPHVVNLAQREANTQARGVVTMTDLVRAAMRMRPDRIVLGECRGAEVATVLTALNTGHAGGWATLHANAATEVPARVLALGALAGLGPEAIALQAQAAIGAVIHLQREGQQRFAQCLALTSPGDGATWRVEPVYTVTAQGEETFHPGWERACTRLGLPPQPPDDEPRKEHE